MWVGNFSPNADGILLFDPATVREYYKSPIAKGTNLLERYLKTDEGDHVLAAGLFVPILGVWGGEHAIIVHLLTEAFTPPGEIVVENGTFALRLTERLVIAGLDALMNWDDGVRGLEIPWPPGNYGVRIRGFRLKDKNRGFLIDYGFEYILTLSAELPKKTADEGKEMQLV